MKHLTEIALLSKFTCRQWSARKFDKKATQAVNDKFHASKAGRFSKYLVDRDDIKKVDAISQQARGIHYTQTLPWLDEGWRILPSTTYFEYTQEMQKLDSQFKRQVQEMMSKYPDRVQEARILLGELFNINEYPTEGELAAKYYFGVSFRPVPIGEDFRCNIKASELEKISADIATQTNEAMMIAVKDLYERIASVLKCLRNRLSEPDGVFRNSLVENVCQLMEILPKLNITKDIHLMKIHQDITSNICSLQPDTLRQDKMIRKNTADKADEILSKMAGYIN